MGNVLACALLVSAVSGYGDQYGAWCQTDRILEVSSADELPLLFTTTLSHYTGKYEPDKQDNKHPPKPNQPLLATHHNTLAQWQLAFRRWYEFPKDLGLSEWDDPMIPQGRPAINRLKQARQQRLAELQGKFKYVRAGPKALKLLRMDSGKAAAITLQDKPMPPVRDKDAEDANYIAKQGNWGAKMKEIIPDAKGFDLISSKIYQNQEKKLPANSKVGYVEIYGARTPEEQMVRLPVNKGSKNKGKTELGDVTTTFWEKSKTFNGNVNVNRLVVGVDSITMEPVSIFVTLTHYSGTWYQITGEAAALLTGLTRETATHSEIFERDPNTHAYRAPLAQAQEAYYDWLAGDDSYYEYDGYEHQLLYKKAWNRLVAAEKDFELVNQLRIKDEEQRLLRKKN